VTNESIHGVCHLLIQMCARASKKTARMVRVISAAP
jgi:hypothetical protein